MIDHKDLGELEDLINRIVDERLTEYHVQNIVPYLKNNNTINKNHIIEVYTDRIYEVLAGGKVRYLYKDNVQKELGIHDINLTNAIMNSFVNKYASKGAYKGKNTSRKVYITLRGVE